MILFLQFIVTVLLSGGAYFCATIYPHAWILMWFMPLPICLYALKKTWVAAFITGFLVFLIGNAAEPFVYWHTALPITVFLYSIVLNAFVYALLLLLFRFIALRSKHWTSSFVLAGGWVVYDFFTALYSGGATYSNIAYTQLLNLPVLQLASITGIWGITFLLILIPTSIAFAWHYKNIAGFRFKVLVLPFVYIALVILFGMYRLFTPLPSTAIKIGIASPHVDRAALISAFKNPTSKIEQANLSVIKQAIKNVETLAKSKVDVVLLPEVMAIIPQPDHYHILQLLTNTARNNKVTLIVGLITKEKDKAYNSAYMFLSNGKMALRHDKIHLVPGLEAQDFVPGNKNSILKTKDKGIWGLLICRDMDYEQPARQYGKEGVNILFVPGWDFDFDAWMHGRYAYMRAVENGYAVARAGRAGLLILIDSRGRIVKMESALTRQEAQNMLIGTLNIGEGKTFYSKYGSWFAWLCCFTFVLRTLVLLIKRKQ